MKGKWEVDALPRGVTILKGHYPIGEVPFPV